MPTRQQVTKASPVVVVVPCPPGARHPIPSSVASKVISSKDGTMVVNPDKTSTNNLPYVLKYDDPLESDEEVDPRDPEDFIEEIDVTRTEPDLEAEYRRAEYRIVNPSRSCANT